MSFGIHLACQRLDELGDPLSELKSLIDWEAFRPIMEGIYDNRTGKGGYPNYDEVLMIKIMALQHWHILSDQKMELEMAKNISFMRFLDFQEDIPSLRQFGFSKNDLMKKSYLMPFGESFKDNIGDSSTKGVLANPRGTASGTWATNADSTRFVIRKVVRDDASQEEESRS